MTSFKMSFPVCQNWEKRTRIVRRGPRVDKGGYFEQQEFICPQCNVQIQRRVNTNGTVPDEGVLPSAVAHN